jgi:hypothetical protein
MTAPGILLAATTVIVGWLALLPLRDRLGPLGYHACAIPAGVLGWSVVASVSMALESGWTVWLVAGSLFIWCGGVWLIAWLTFGRWPEKRLPTPGEWAGHAIFLGGVLLVAMIFSLLGVSAFSADGWSQYEPDGMVLSEVGRIAERALGNRMVSVSALHAAYHFFGGEFTHVIQPVLAMATALIVGAGIWWSTARRLALRWRALVTAVPVLAMLTNAVYAFHAIYIHSHMISAMFLALAMVALLKGSDAEDMDCSWLIVAGLGTAGVVLSRPDGAAYAVVPILVASALLVRATNVGRSVPAAFFGPLLGAVSVVVVGGIVQHGNWWTRKLSLQTLLIFLALYAFTWVLVRAICSGNHTGWLRTGTNPLRLAVALDFLALFVAWRVWFDTVMHSLSNMMSNLLSTGGYRSFWPLMSSVVVISLSLRPNSSRHRFTAYALFAVVQFMVIAFVLHGIRHPGRIGWGDSFTRVSFQIVPVIYLYVGLYIGELARAVLGRDQAGHR